MGVTQTTSPMTRKMGGVDDKCMVREQANQTLHCGRNDIDVGSNNLDQDEASFPCAQKSPQDLIIE